MFHQQWPVLKASCTSSVGRHATRRAGRCPTRRRTVSSSAWRAATVPLGTTWMSMSSVCPSPSAPATMMGRSSSQRISSRITTPRGKCTGRNSALHTVTLIFGWLELLNGSVPVHPRKLVKEMAGFCLQQAKWRVLQLYLYPFYFKSHLTQNY